ncbi:DUF6572 domain-containing protein [Cupriavidus sp. 30B13]|uniref:DUF6572 domain-containing protein n=1 Tax=Cupriavidus sp. 30B13 TaxID=3384241 RepID=UPI003B90EE24
MTVENANAVDGMGIAKDDGKVVLTISDHLTWDDEASHFSLLEQKIGAYLGFIGSGQMEEVLPDSKGRTIRIQVVCQHGPNEAGMRFLTAAQQQLLDMGVELRFGALPEGY